MWGNINSKAVTRFSEVPEKLQRIPSWSIWTPTGNGEPLACWKNYEMLATKQKLGKTFPKCVLKGQRQCAKEKAQARKQK